MMNRHKSFVLPTVIILLLITLFSGCKEIQWGGDLSKLNNDISTSCFFYTDSTENSPYIKFDYIIGETYSVPEFTREQIYSLRPGYMPKGWKLKNPVSQTESISLDSDGYLVSFKVGYKAYEFVSDWVEATDTPYTVIHKKEMLDGNYEVADTEVCYGTTGTSTNAGSRIKSYTGFQADMSITEKNIEADGSTVVAIDYLRNLYSVVFYDSDGSTVIRTSLCKYGLPLSAPSLSVPAGKRFVGWALTTAPGTVITLPSTVTGAMNFIAVYADVYTVEFILDGGTTSTVFDDITDDGNGHIASGKFFGIAGETLPAVATPNKTNMNFLSWYVDGDVSKTPVIIPSTFTGNAVYKANYALKTQSFGGMTITFPDVADALSEGSGSGIARIATSTDITFTVPATYDSYTWSVNGVLDSSTSNTCLISYSTMTSGIYEVVVVCFDSSGKATTYIQNFTVVKDN